MFRTLRQAAEDISDIDVPLELREFRPHKLYYPVPFQFKPLPSEYEETWFIWKGFGNNFALPFLDVLLELDICSIAVGGVTMFLYSYISQDISYGLHYVWPSSRHEIEDMFPLERISACVWIRVFVFFRYSTRFMVGGGIYLVIKSVVQALMKNRLTPFKFYLLSGTIFSMSCANRYSFQRPIWKFINGLWTGLAMAFCESVLDTYFYAIRNIPASDMPFRLS